MGSCCWNLPPPTSPQLLHHSDDDTDSDVSDASSTSTNLTVKLNRNYSYPNIARTTAAGNSVVSSLQHSRSLSSLPLAQKNLDNNENTNNAKLPFKTHNKLSRARGFSESHLKPRVTFSLHPELICSERVGAETGHKKLTRRENVLIKSNVKCDDSDCKDETETETDVDTTTDPYDTIPDEDSKSDTDKSSDSEEYYKTIRGTENVYSYAYKDSISPAALIQLENASIVSEVSESFYDILGSVAQTSKVETMSDSMSEREDMFFSISKGRRKYLKFHKYVGWDLNSVAEDNNEEQHDPHHDTPTNLNDAKHSRLLPLLLHEEKKQIIAENNKIPKYNSEDVRYYKYAQYKNVRTSKIKRMIRKDKEQQNTCSQPKLTLNFKKSIRKSVSRISIFNENKDRRVNLKMSLRRKLTSMLSYMKIF